MSNFRLEGSITNHHLPKTNIIWGYAFNDPTLVGWLSDDQETDIEIKQTFRDGRGSEFYIARPLSGGGGNVMEFNLNLFRSPTRKLVPEKLNIFMYEEDSNNHFLVVTLYGLKYNYRRVYLDELGRFNQIPSRSDPTYEVFCFSWGAEYEIRDSY